MPGFLILGRILKPYGVRGEVKVASWAEGTALLCQLAECWVGPPDGAWQAVAIERSRLQGRAVILKLAGVGSPEAARSLVGREVAIPREAAPDPPEGSYYHADLLGLAVTDGERALGAVVEILETAAHDVLVVRGEAGEWLLPATRAHIRRIDLASRRLEIQPMDGLIEATGGGGAGAEEL
ncbi:MAG: 16S rRNA processing protein RimM [candidate division NC10 bacterium]|nr:16S rRNA processing protein RimM [candidate division NC10 bacterium]